MLEYEKIRRKNVKENMTKVLKEYKNPDFQEKIRKYAEKFDIDQNSLEKRIKSNDKIVISIFAKDPSKQNFYEKTAAEYIKQIKGVKDFHNLPNGGQNALFINEDKIIKKKNFNGKLLSKSIDFKWKFSIKNMQYYAFHKYIHENGGAQDNQFNDVLISIKVAKSINSKAIHKILFICDGKYFTNIKLDILKKTISNKNHLVLTIDEIESYLNENS